MNTQTKLVKKLIYVAGVASASIGLSLPAFAINPSAPVNSANSSANIRELVAQGAGGSGNQGPGSATPGRTSTDTPPSSSGDNAPSSGTPAPNGGSGNSNMGGKTSSPSSSPSTPSGSSSATPSTTNRSDLKPGTWLCVNNPNPQCKG